jgi:cytochrome bd-type quinol oxidase subunit 1
VYNTLANQLCLAEERPAMKPELRIKLIREFEKTKNQLKSDEYSSRGYFASIFGLVLLLIFLPYIIYILLLPANNYSVILWILPVAVAAGVVMLILSIIRYHVNRKIFAVYEILKMSSDSIESE